MNAECSFLTAGRFRLILAIVVLLHHTLGFFGFGASAVYLFFILSGYWISRLWHSNHIYTLSSILGYYLSRWLRLAPILVAVFLIALICGRLFSGLFPAESDIALSSPLWWLKSLLIAPITTQQLVIGPAWSLAVEMQFYLIFPFLGWLALKSKYALWIIFTASLTFGIYSFASGVSATSGNIFIFLPYFIIGIIHERSPITIRTQHSILLAIIYLLLAMVLAFMPMTNFIVTNYPGKSAFMVIIQNLWFYIATFLIGPLACETVHRLRYPGDRFFGNLAYPLYFFHIIPVTFYYHYRDIISFPKPIMVIACWLVSVIGAMALYFLVDRPFEALRKLFTQKLTQVQTPKS